MKDKLTDFERAEYYKTLYEQSIKSRTTAIIVFSIISMLIGFVTGNDLLKI